MKKNNPTYPVRYVTSYATPSGEEIAIRPVKPADERGLEKYFSSFSEEDVYFRFFSPIKDFSEKRIAPLVNIDYSKDMVLICEHAAENGIKTIIGGGGFFRTSDPSKAELSLSVSKEWRKQGIAKFLLQYLIQIAQELGYRQLVAFILFENRPMLHIIQNTGYPADMKAQENQEEVTLDIS